MENALHLSAPEHDWLAYLAHDFRVPLAHIRQTVALLESLASNDGVDRDRLLEFTATIRRELGEAESLRSEIVAHLSLDRSEPNFGFVRLDEILEGVANRLEMDADLKEIELDYRMPAKPIQVRGDAALLSRVFQNLILNAIESTPRLGFVGIEVEAHADRVHVIVSDSGPGIPEHVVRRLTDPASRSSSGDGVRPDGRGLGLIFVRRALELHGGRIAAEPGNDGGAQLIVDLSLNGNSSPATPSAE